MKGQKAIREMRDLMRNFDADEAAINALGWVLDEYPATEPQEPKTAWQVKPQPVQPAAGGGE